MNIWKNLSAGLMTGFVVAASHSRTQTTAQHAATSSVSDPEPSKFIVLFGPLTAEAARSLPPYLRTSGFDEDGTSEADPRVTRLALALIAKAIEYIDHEGPLIDEYREG